MADRDSKGRSVDEKNCGNPMHIREFAMLISPTKTTEMLDFWVRLWIMPTKPFHQCVNTVCKIILLSKHTLDPYEYANINT